MITKDIAKAAFISGLLAVAGIALVIGTQRDRERIRAFCQPRGYVGGFDDKYLGFGCISRDGRHVYAREIERVE